MIKIVLIEDENPAREKLKRFLNDVSESIEIVAEIKTVEEAITFLKVTQVDLIISDIELLDGNAFLIYGEVSVTCPIIFTTAYNQFWMNAFETNGIDYLLKPYSFDRFKKAWDKFLLFRKSTNFDFDVLSKLTKVLENTVLPSTYKSRFTIGTHQGMYFIETSTIACFEANEGVVFAIDVFGKQHLIKETTLKEVELQLNPKDYFRINRSVIVARIHIEKIERYSKNSLALKMKGQKKTLQTSQNTTAVFREWVEK